MNKLRSTSRKSVTLGPVFPNGGVQVWYNRQLDALIRQSAGDLISNIVAAWKKTPPLFNSHIVSGDELIAQDAPSPTKALQAALARWGAQSIKRFDLMSQKLAEGFAARSMQATQTSLLSQLRKAGFTVEFKPTLRSIESYRALAAENVSLIKSIPRKWHTEVEQKVWNAVRGGSDLYTLSKDLRETYGVTSRRAALISRDQNNKAKATIERVRRQELGITRAIWMHSHAGKEPRPTHVKMSGKPYKVDKGMYDSDEDAYIWPGELINCRCTDRAVIEGFEDETGLEDQTTIIQLQVALKTAKRYEDTTREAQMLESLERLRKGRTTWEGLEQEQLRESIDKYLEEATA